jgi:hypothetical protein
VETGPVRKFSWFEMAKRYVDKGNGKHVKMDTKKLSLVTDERKSSFENPNDSIRSRVTMEYVIKRIRQNKHALRPKLDADGAQLLGQYQQQHHV